MAAETAYYTHNPIYLGVCMLGIETFSWTMVHGGKTFVFVILSPVDLVKSTDVKPDVIDFV